jgi:ribosome biogenesis GTPase A
MGNIRELKKVETPKPRVAFVGMTNAGKSSLINALYI